MTTNRICWLLAGLVLILAVWSGNAKAETYLYAGAWSKHFGNEEYNEQHDLIAIEHKNVIAGYFRNSYDEDALTAGYKFKRDYGPLEAGVMAGAVYGYRHCFKGWAEQDRRVCPMLAPYVSWDAGPVNPTVLVLGNAVAISIRIEL